MSVSTMSTSGASDATRERGDLIERFLSDVIQIQILSCLARHENRSAPCALLRWHASYQLMHHRIEGGPRTGDMRHA